MTLNHRSWLVNVFTFHISRFTYQPVKNLSLVSISCAVLCTSLPAHANLNVVATLPDLAAVAREIGGDLIKVSSLAVGTEDPHFVDPKPSFIRVLNQADMLIEGGAELEAGWLPPLVNNARNPKILGTALGHVIASKGVHLLEVPVGGVDRSQGDVHPLGNPHYLLDPDNARIVAAQLAETLGRLDSTHASEYEANGKRFQERLAQKLPEWEKVLAPFRGTKVITYHKSFNYLLEHFGFVLAGTIEPKPGIEPSPAHINELTREAKQTSVRLVVIEPNRPRKTAQKVADSIGAKLLVLPLMPGGNEKAKDFFGWYDYNVARIAEALRP
jgi:zinc/manganese transport system substrate-binding protein